MGFALWVEKEVACAFGTHEYRPMGAAVIARTDLFSPRHFRACPRPPAYPDRCFRGYFASLGEVNEHLRQIESQAMPKKLSRALRRVKAVI